MTPELRMLPEGQPHPINLWTTNLDMFHLIDQHILKSSKRERYDIATWYWELLTVPDHLLERVEWVDEIWVPSQFVQRTLARYTNRPVIVVPPVVQTGLARAKTPELRHRLGLPENAIIFLFTFDYNSTVARKNPLAAVEAFRRAFPASARGRDVYIVMKGMNLQRNPAVAASLRKAIAEVGGVLINQYLPISDLADLFHACDVYLSLHRAEGFGLGLAEAMVIGKAVIGTAYSGNLEFMTSANSCLVGYEPRAITGADHRYNNYEMLDIYSEGETWAEPNIDQAVTWMRILAEDEGLRQRIGAQAARDIPRHLGEAKVAKVAVDRLRKLSLELGDSVGPLCESM